MAPKKRCMATDCKSAALRYAGECTHCQSIHCSDHRLPEHHSCVNYEDCRQAAFQRNKDKLESERTVANKMAVV